MTRPPRSLMAQILRWHAIAVLITAVAVAGGVYLFLDTTAARIQHQTVHVHAQALRQALSQDARGRLHLTQDRTSAAVFAPGAGFAFRIVHPRGTALFRSDSPILVPLDVQVIPINGDGSDQAAAAIRALKGHDFADIDAFLEREVARYGVKQSPAMQVTLRPELTRQPPAPPRDTAGTGAPSRGAPAGRRTGRPPRRV